MNEFEQSLAGIMGGAALQKIRSTHVGIAGAGGLGSNCAANLVRCGFRRFTIVDFDRVELSNLNRQFFFLDQVGRSKVDMLGVNLLAINPDLDLSLYNQKIDETNMREFFDPCDIIVEAFDRIVDKKLIIETYANAEKLMVSASGLAGWGSSDDIKIHAAGKNFFLVGDLISEADGALPPVSPRVNIAAAKQADIILAHVIGAHTMNTKETSREQE